MAFSRGECQIKPLLAKIDKPQVWLAKQTGISPRMISFYANNNKPMSVEAMYRVACVLKCHMEELYNGLVIDFGQ